ncbi:hypothetical protein GTP91_15455 [Rugamonas sp. FT82W]|uniref:Type VI secretion system component TssM1 N-terminal domain-containing protein n=1 Tax=Duganella vulcania TaxID=2692166 RepID=A0A845G591_9BURK|nr:hypothetical protein [Duganella vulcania]
MVFNFLSDNTAIATLLVLTLLVMLLFAVVIWAAMKGAEKADKPADQKPRLISADSLKQSFRVAVELIENNIAARSERYSLAWTLVLNEDSAGRELPLLQSGLQSALSADSTLTAGAQGINWNFFDQGIAVQLQSDYLGAPDPEASGGNTNTTWDDFLGLCRNYRPDRPFDSIVVAIPARAFLDADGTGQLDLAARAKAIHRRLWLAQNRLALRFPIYLAITDCETIPGFARFAAALPEPLRRSMLGWSSPHELAAPFQAQWMETAMNEIVRTLSDSCAELCALEPSDSDSSEYFLLPNQVERLRAGLKLFAEELMRPSAYHEPFLLRGIYLTGDCSDEAALLGDGAAPADDGFQPVDQAAATPPATLPDRAEPTLAGGAAPAWVPGQGSAVPAFLRDIFERKIFAEAGLVRSSSVHRMRRPAMNRMARWVAVGIPVVWVVGLLFATLNLHRLSSDVVVYLHKLDRDSRASLLASSHNVVDPAQSRQRAMEALQNIEQMGNARLGSLFMPGSWPWFDNLHQRVQNRMEKGFADNAFDPLRRSMYSRVSELTGVPIDPISGSLIIGGRCTLPARWNEMTAAPNTALNMENLPEFSALLQYVARMEQLDQVQQAMMRLKSASSGPPSGDDLGLVVRVLLGTELNGDPARTAKLFRQVAKEVQSLTVEPLQEAASCSFKLAVRATAKRMFVNNGLLKAEQTIGETSAALYEADPKADAATNIAIWQALRTALRAQEAYLTTGKGAWMHRTTPDLGPAWDNLLQKVESVALLGKAAADDARKQTDDGFNQFISLWDATLSADSHSQGLSSGLEWSEANSAWTFAADRKALLDALNGLLSQPFMKVNHLSRLPDVPAGSTVSWDGSRLDQVLALGDARKRVQTDFLPKFPNMLQAPAARLADGALAETARDMLSQAYIVSAREVQAPAAEADRAKALRIRSWLQDIAAGGVADNLTAVLSRDALTRLQLLDETLTRAEVFVPRDRAFRSWNGEKAPLLDAFGAADAGALAAYVQQQQAFIEATGKDAETLLMQLGGAGAGNPLVTRWQATLADLNRYKLKSPTSSLGALEQFVLSGAADLDINNCLDKLSARAAQRRATDVFSERMQGLQAGLYSRCRELLQTGYQDAWTRFADAFNAGLANRAPFRSLAPDANAKGGAADRVPADVDEVGSVLKLFDHVHVLALASDRDPTRPSPASTVRKVDEQMQKVREFLAPLYPSEEGQAAGLDVMAEFRANSAAESEGNQIIDWSLSIGGHTLHQRDAPRALRWEPGLPVVLTLRVAQDGPAIPKAEAGHPGMAVDGRTVSYRFDDPWALFSFVSAYRETDAGSAAASGARSQLLKFEFPMSAVGDGRIQTRDSRARVYVRLTVSAAGKRTPLAWPPVFPVKAPAW